MEPLGNPRKPPVIPCSAMDLGERPGVYPELPQEKFHGQPLTTPGQCLPMSPKQENVIQLIDSIDGHGPATPLFSPPAHSCDEAAQPRCPLCGHRHRVPDAVAALSGCRRGTGCDGSATRRLHCPIRPLTCTVCLHKGQAGCSSSCWNSPHQQGEQGSKPVWRSTSHSCRARSMVTEPQFRTRGVRAPCRSALSTSTTPDGQAAWVESTLKRTTWSPCRSQHSRLCKG